MSHSSRRPSLCSTCWQLVAMCVAIPTKFCFFSSALGQWRRGNIALVTTLPVPDCLNLVHHLQPRRLEDRFLPQQPRKKGHSPAQSLQHIISHLPAVLRLPGSVHLQAKEIHRKMTAQSCPRKNLVFKENFRPACLDCLTEYRCTCSITHSKSTSKYSHIPLPSLLSPSGAEHRK